MRRSPLTQCLALVAIVSNLPAHAEPVRIAPRLVDGPVGVFAVTTETKQTAAVTGEPEKSIVYRLDARTRIEFRAATPEKATAAITYDRIAIKLDSPGMKNEFDSDWPAARDGESAFGPAVRGAVGKTVTASVSATGEIGEIEGLDAVAPAGPQGDAVRQLLNPTGIRELLETILGIRHDAAPCEAGVSWTEVQELPNLLGVIRLSETRTLRSVEHDRATIGIAGSGTLERKADAAPGGQFVTLKSAVIEGDASWDVKAGRLERLSHTLTMVVLDEDPVRQGKSLTQTVVTRTNIEVNK